MLEQNKRLVLGYVSENKTVFVNGVTWGILHRNCANAQCGWSVLKPVRTILDAKLVNRVLYSALTSVIPSVIVKEYLEVSVLSHAGIEYICKDKNEFVSNRYRDDARFHVLCEICNLCPDMIKEGAEMRAFVQKIADDVCTEILYDCVHRFGIKNVEEICKSEVV